MNTRLAMVVLWMAAVLLLAACGSRESRDGPGRGLDPERIAVPEPRPEPLARYGNHSPYTVLGRTYHVRETARGYSERGLASWYGSKFHGKPTSSGEPFDMHQVSAAHRTLPLPSWVEVTNLDNGRSLVVRVNDRGPFKDGRIIDLSYAAAVKLGVVDAGTAPVEVRALEFDDMPMQAASGPRRVPVELQVGAFSDRDRARNVARSLEEAGIGPVYTGRGRSSAGRVWRVRVGPIDTAETASRLAERILGLGMERPVYVYP